MERAARLAGDLFWSAIMILVLLIVGVFILRLVGRVPAMSGIVGKIENAATPNAG
jgi:hypothetical protein